MTTAAKSVPQTDVSDSSRSSPSVSAAAPDHDVRRPRIERAIGNFAMQRVVQASLRVARADDPYEAEADRVADEVTAGSPKHVAPRGGALISRTLMRRPEEDTEEPQQAATDTGEKEDEELRAQAKNDGSGVPHVTPHVHESIRRSEGHGISLPESTRGLFEPRIGHDFSQVRIHADSQAALAARSLNAVAFTHGRDIYFGAGRYQPESTSGRHLLAHELTHVVQQGSAAAIQRKESPDQENDAANDTGAAAQTAATGQTGAVMHRAGMVACTPTSPSTQYLRQVPSPQTGPNVIGVLSFNTPVFVDRRGGAGNEWYQITTMVAQPVDRGDLPAPVAMPQQGWVPAAAIAVDPPEPAASLYRIQAGDTPIDLARLWYGPFEKKSSMPWASSDEDARFYVGALAYANKGRAGMPSPSDFTQTWSWALVKLREGHTIWRPDKSFLDSLKGEVSSGSITRDVWEKVKSAAVTVGGWLVYGAAFVAGIFYGAAESIYDLVVGVADLVKMIWDVAKSIILGTIVSDAQKFWEELKQIKFSELETSFLSKWNAPDLWDQAFFRGRVVGYIIMEILMLVFSDGILTAIKWVGKFAKIGELIAKLPKVVKVIEATKNLKKVPAKIKDIVKSALEAREAAAKERKLSKLKKPVDAAVKAGEEAAAKEAADAAVKAGEEAAAKEAADAAVKAGEEAAAKEAADAAVKAGEEAAAKEAADAAKAAEKTGIPADEKIPSPEPKPEKKPPKPTPKFEKPTNPPQMPPKEIPEGWRVREMGPTEQYPNGYWKLEKPMKNGKWQPIDPSTMKPGTRPQTHVEFPTKKGS